MNTITTAPLRSLVDGINGENYWLNSCLAFAMECLHESRDYDYWFFSGVTGDSFLQVFSRDPERMVLCYSDRFTDAALQQATQACGYPFQHVLNIDGPAERQQLLTRIRASIDRGIPVITRLDDAFRSFAAICAYDGDDLYCLYGEDDQLQSCGFGELIFIGERQSRPSLADAYRNAVLNIPNLLKQPATPEFSFGRQAFCDWAASFRDGVYDAYPAGDKIWATHPESDFGCWNMHGTYLCMLGTNACSVPFLMKALALNPDMRCIERLIPLYNQQCKDGFYTLVKMEGGFGIQPEVIKDRERMRPISDEIERLADLSSQILEAF